MQRPHTRVIMGAFAALQIMIGTVIQFQYHKLSRGTNPCDEKLWVWRAHPKAKNFGTESPLQISGNLDRE